MGAFAIGSCRSVLRRVSLLLMLLASVCGPALAQSKAPQETKQKIRAITAFVLLDRTQFQQQIADAVKMLNRARTIFESRGFEVQTIRIATQPFPEYTKGLTDAQALAFFKVYDALAVKSGFDAAIGPAMMNATDSPAQADLLADVLLNTKKINGTVVVGAEDGVRWPAVGSAARVMKRLEDTEHSQGNFRFATIAMVPLLTPFFPAAYVTGFGHQFAIALESANIVAAAFKDAPDLATAKRRLIDALGKVAFDAEAQAGRVDSETGWAYIGI